MKTLHKIRCLQASPAGGAKRAVAAIVGLILSAAMGPAPPAFAGGDAPGVFSPLPAGAVRPDARFNALFTRTDGGWTGGDGTYSVRLPDGRTVWMFGDSFLGRVRPDRTRPKSSPLINNCFVIQSGAELLTLHGGTAGEPRSMVVPAGGDGFYWPGDGWVENDRLHVFFNRFVRTGSGPWQWRWLGTDAIRFSLPDLAQVSVRPVEAENGVMYGSAVLEGGRHVYVYGTEESGRDRYAHVARFPAGGITGRWRYFAGRRRWSGDAGMSARLLGGVSNQFSVLKVGGRYLLITSDNRQPLDPGIVMYVSPSPVGPFQPGVKIYDPPEAGKGVIAYNALAHPQYSENGWLLISYNLNPAADFDTVYRSADRYRPRFIRVKLTAVIDGLPDG